MFSLFLKSNSYPLFLFAILFTKCDNLYVINAEELSITIQRLMLLNNEYIDALYLGKNIETIEELRDKNIVLLNKAFTAYKNINDIYTQ